MKKITCFILILTMVLSSTLGVMAQDFNNITTSIDAEEFNNIIINRMEERGISVRVNDAGEIVLKNPTSKNIKDANNNLKMDGISIQSTYSTNSKSYPTLWTHMGSSDIIRNTTIAQCTEVAFINTLGAFLLAKGSMTPELLAGTFAVSFFSQLYLTRNEETIYTIFKHYYRELGPGWFDANGTFYGEYQIAIVERVTVNPDLTGGTVNTTYQTSTTLVPWMLY